jgi:prepilin-type processing-associated H-X9-DG protein
MTSAGTYCPKNDVTIDIGSEAFPMRQIRERGGRHGVTWAEVLIALIAIGVLGVLLIVSVNGAREAARKSACFSNLKQIGLALLQYEAHYKSFPCGARVRTNPKTDEWVGDWGPSWWVAVGEVADRNGFGRGQRDESEIETSYLLTSTTNNGLAVNGYVPGYMHCPSSPLPVNIVLPNPQQITATSVTVPTPTYVAISGTVPDITAIPLVYDWQTNWQPNVPNATNPPQGATPRCTQQAIPEGTVGGNGVFPPNQWITIKQILDGASNTILVGEQSDFGIDATNENRQVDIRSCSLYGAWIGLGNTGGQNIKTIDPTLPGTITPYNCTTIAFPINSKIIQDASSPLSRQKQITVPGLVGNNLNQIPPPNPSGLGNNNGIQSVHAGGASVAYADGRVTFLTDGMDFRILLYLSCRDDGRVFMAP